MIKPLLSDIFPTAYFSADIAKVKTGSVVVVMGCGPVGQFAIASARLLGAARILAIDNIVSRLEMARAQGAECINFDVENPVEVLKDTTQGALADVVIDAVGVDAETPSEGPAARREAKNKNEYKAELKEVAPKIKTKGNNWKPGDAPSQVLRTSVELVGKCGTISIIGVYPEAAKVFPIGKAMNKNISIVMGNCPHKKYIPKLLQLVQAGIIDPTEILTQEEPLVDVITAYKLFDLREPGWIKVALKP